MSAVTRGSPAELARRTGLGAWIGLLSAGTALGVGELVAAFVRPAAAPVIAVGNRFVLLAPESVKRWAIRNFGANDKHVLLTGIYVVVAVLAVLIGILALRRISLGISGIVIFGAVGCWSALTAHASRPSDVVPTLFGTVAAVAVLVWLCRIAPPAEGRRRDESADGEAVGPGRRRFLQGSAAAAAAAVAGGFGGRAAQHARFDVAAARAAVRLPPPAEVAPALPSGVDLGKSAVPWQTPNRSFYRVDTALTVPQVDPRHWSLRIHGMVDREVRLSYQELTTRPLIERWITLCCVSNPVGGPYIGNARFLGARLADVLRTAGVSPAADQLLMTSADGMTIGAPAAVVMDGRDALIAIGMNGEPLPVQHGFPARIVVPGLYGYTSACKWVVDIEATTFANAAAYWVSAGWDPHPSIKLASRIDSPRSGSTVPAGRPVAVAGIAWDQHVGVSRVDVQVGDGPWLPARLASVPSTDTWRQWVVTWTPPRPGSYVLRVRAADAAGNPQTTQPADPFPSGATGLHTITVRAR
jgi:DMSO/TMAO reductase YedYZ molybdopterin-dependent catalytic subunit